MTARRWLLWLACLAVGCEKAPEPVAPMAQSGELVVLTVNGPVTYFEDAQGLPSGLEYDLGALFAAHLRVKPTFVVIDNPAGIDRFMRAGQAHIAAAALPRQLDLPGGLAWGPTYLTSQLQLVGRRGEARPKSLDDVAGKRVGVIEESAAERLLALPAALAGHVERMPPGTSTADLLEQVADGRLDHALVESTRFTLARRYFPQLEVALPVGKPVEYAWLISTVDRKRIAQAAEPFFAKLRRDGTLERLVERYYGHAARITAIDSGTLIARIATELPRLKPWFLQAEQLSGVDWRLLAAMAYQESHWDPLATSPTGVRGMMMLTEETAKRLQVADRLDPQESILGGARYFMLLKEAMSPRIGEPDRTWLALAAYNLGLGHLEDARVLAQRSGLDPDKWQDVRRVLPRLAEPEHFLTLRHGYARGFEAIQLVDNVRNYYDILARHEPRDGPLLPPSAPGDQLSTNGTTPGR